MYVCKSWSVKFLVKSDPKYTNKPEYLIAELRKSNTKLLIAVTLLQDLSAFSTGYHNINVTGDFNANLPTPTKPETTILTDPVKSHALSIVSTESTHHVIALNPPSHTTLDLFVNNIEIVIHFSKSTSPFIAGHVFNICILNIQLYCILAPLCSVHA